MKTNDRFKSLIYKRVEDLDKNYLESLKTKVNQDNLYYPSFHIAPEFGLLNDPNGLSYFKGEYHIFYQYCPNGPMHGMKNWYHLTTKDFVNYQSHGIKLKPEREFENYGIYSGGAKVIDGMLNLFYTANYRDENNNYKRIPKQAVAVMNKDYEIVSKEVIIESDLTTHTEHARDPLPFSLANDNYILLGQQNKQNMGELKLFKVDDKFKNVIEESVVKTNFELDAYMYECPSYFNDGDKECLLFSPQGLKSDNKYNYVNVNDVVYSVSNLGDIKDYTWDGSEIKQLDYGFDFYAPQIFKDDKSRNILIAWLGQAVDAYPYDEEYGWSQMLSLAREVIIKDDHIYQLPVKEYEQLREDKVVLTGDNQVTKRAFELEVELDDNFEIKLGNDTNYLRITGDDTEYCLDVEHCDQVPDQEYKYLRYAPRISSGSKLNIFVDHSAIEIYINNGELTMTSRFFIKDISSLSIDGLVEGVMYNLNDFEIKRSILDE